jgi:hypothetical protein
MEQVEEVSRVRVMTALPHRALFAVEVAVLVPLLPLQVAMEHF